MSTVKPTKRVPLGPAPVLIEVPAGHQAALWGSVPFALEKGSVMTGRASLHSEGYVHTERGEKLSVKAIADRFGVLEVTFRPDRVRPTPRSASTEESHHL